MTGNTDKEFLSIMENSKVDDGENFTTGVSIDRDYPDCELYLAEKVKYLRREISCIYSILVVGILLILAVLDSSVNQDKTCFILIILMGCACAVVCMLFRGYFSNSKFFNNAIQYEYNVYLLNKEKEIMGVPVDEKHTVRADKLKTIDSLIEQYEHKLYKMQK